MDSFSWGKMNFTRIGKSLREARRVPRHSAGISLHAMLSVFPLNGPVAILQSTPVSQASPSGSARLDFSGESGPGGRGHARWGRAYSASITGTESMGRGMASSAACCAMDVGLEVDWLCNLTVA